MYFAVRRIKGPNGWIEPGDKIPDAKDWPLVPLKACINLGLIEEVKGEKDLPTPSVVGGTGGVAGGNLGCIHCPGKVFKTKGGLSSHMRSHR